jgi:hypothetical protein
MTVDGEDDLLVAATASDCGEFSGDPVAFEPRQADGPMWPLWERQPTRG